MNVFRIVTRHGITIDITPTGPFNLHQAWATICVNGFFANENIVVPRESISFIGYGEPAMLAQHNHAPSTETRQ